jgi:hypothetical protein
MKKLMQRIGQAVFSCGCGLVCAIGACYVSAYEYAPVAGWFGGCIMGMLVSGAFDLAEERKAEHKTLSQGYREAA